MVIVGVEYVMKLVLKGIYEYLKFIKFLELLVWVRVVGLGVNSVYGMSVNLVMMEFKISNDVGVNYFLYCSKFNWELNDDI